MAIVKDTMHRYVRLYMSSSTQASGSSRNWEGGGGAPARVWRGVGRSSRWGRPGEGAGGGHPSRPARGVGERCKLSHRGLGRSPRSQRFLRRKPPKKYVKTALKM